jgi:hypothetical protein
MTREDRLVEIDDYIRYLDALYDEVTIGTAGGTGDRARILPGTATAARWLAQGNAGQAA